MFEASDNVLFSSCCRLTFFSILWVFASFTLLFKHVVRDSLVRWQDGIDKELVVIGGMQESDYLWRLFIHMVVICSVFTDFL